MYIIQLLRHHNPEVRRAADAQEARSLHEECLLMMFHPFLFALHTIDGASGANSNMYILFLHFPLCYLLSMSAPFQLNAGIHEAV